MRAARGAGYDWGLAEEAGRAARWLAARGLPGPEILAALLSVNDGRAYAALAPADDAGVWRAPDGALCPLAAGAAIGDRAGEIAAGREIILGATAYPLLLAPFAVGVAEAGGVPVRLCWDAVDILGGADGAAVVRAGRRGALNAAATHAARCAPAPGDPAGAVLRASAAGRDVDAAAWSRLSALAARTYAPATEASRLRGAGAGNDDD